MIVTFGLTRAASFTSARRELPNRGRPGQCVAPDGGGRPAQPLLTGNPRTAVQPAGPESAPAGQRGRPWWNMPHRMAAAIPCSRRTEGPPIPLAAPAQAPVRLRQPWGQAEPPPPHRRSRGRSQNRSSLPGGMFPPSGPGRAQPPQKIWAHVAGRATVAARMAPGPHLPATQQPAGSSGASRTAQPAWRTKAGHLTVRSDRVPGGSRWAAGGPSPATQEFAIRLRRMAFTCQGRPADRATQGRFLPSPGRRQEPGLPLAAHQRRRTRKARRCRRQRRPPPHRDRSAKNTGRKGGVDVAESADAS